MKAYTNFRSSLYYAFRAGASPRLVVFAVILVMNLAFILPGSFGWLPLAAHIVAVSLSGTAIGVMAVFNIIGDVSLCKSMFSPSGAVFYALTPAPRRNTLLASLIAMFFMDFVTMILSIVSVVVLSLNLGSHVSGDYIWGLLFRHGFELRFFLNNILIPFLLVIATYLFFVMLIIYCRAVRKSVLYNKHAGGFLAFSLAVGIYYLFTVSTLLLAPFGSMSWFYGIITISVNYLGMGMYALLHLVFAAVMFILTSRLMERKMNI